VTTIRIRQNRTIFVRTIDILALCQVTKERPSTLVRRLIATEKRLYDSGFLPSYNSKIEK